MENDGIAQDINYALIELKKDINPKKKIQKMKLQIK